MNTLAWFEFNQGPFTFGSFWWFMMIVVLLALVGFFLWYRKRQV